MACSVAVMALSLLPAPAPSSSTGSHSSASTASSLQALLSSGVAEAAPLSNNSTGSVYFRQTAHYLKDAFLNYWLMDGGLSTYGYPVSEEFTRNGVTMQYFERSRFEYNPTSSRPWKVALARVGSMLTEGRTFPPANETTNTSDHLYFDQTGHSVSGAFLQFWQSGGGMEIYGYPISEPLYENGRTVQYFERARFELAAQGRVQLGRLGMELLNREINAGLDSSVAAPRNRPGYNMSFWGEATVFHADWNRMISLNKGWGNLPQDFVGRGLYAAAPADLNLYGRWARVTRGHRSIFVQFVDVINWPDIPYVRSKGIVIDLGAESFRALGGDNGGRYEVSFDVFWPGQEP